MKQVRRFCAVTILALSLTLTAYAGHIPCPGVTGEPPPPPAEQAMSEGNIEAGLTATDPTNFFVSLFQGLMSLF